MRSSEDLPPRSIGAASLVVAFLLSAATLSAQAGLVQTNRTERWVTNLVEVKMQATKLITEYRTNWTEEVWNNIIDMYATNRVTKLYTNRIVVHLLQTNYVPCYHTNLQTIQLTNWHSVPLFRTNLLTRYHTNHVIVDAYRTNVVLAYQTNLKTLRLTNWVTVLQFKTNWVNQPVTNVVTLELPLPRGGMAASLARVSEAERGGIRAEPTADSLAILARRTATPVGAKGPEVQLSLHSKGAVNAALVVQQWRVEREDGSILLFGQGPEFRHALPVGKYKVEVKAREAGTNQLLAALGTLSVLPQDVLMQQKPANKWVSP